MLEKWQVHNYSLAFFLFYPTSEYAKFKWKPSVSRVLRNSAAVLELLHAVWNGVTEMTKCTGLIFTISVTGC